MSVDMPHTEWMSPSSPRRGNFKETNVRSSPCTIRLSSNCKVSPLASTRRSFLINISACWGISSVSLRPRICERGAP